MTRGIIYALIGLLAFMAALGKGGKTTGTKGMFFSLSSLPMGEVLLFAIGIGLLGYSMWNLIKALEDPEKKGRGAKGLMIRTGYLFTAIFYAGIAYSAGKSALHADSRGMSETDISSIILAVPFGRWLTGITGAIILGYGLWEIFTGFKEKFMEQIQVDQMNQKEKKIAVTSGKAGLTSRGILFSMTGYFLILTAMKADPKQTKGIGGALSALAHKPYGHILLAAMGIGLISYGVYTMIRGRYEKMKLGGPN